MNRGDLAGLREWFDGFTAAFSTGDRDDLGNIVLKKVHTANVCRNADRIALAEGLDEGGRTLAIAAALFHDLGRFPQYSRFRTFRDSISVNHGVLGADILVRRRVLDKFPRNEQDSVVAGVRYHNCITVPPEAAAACPALIRLVRDADKIDIWRVFLEYYTAPPGERASAVGLGFPDLPRWTPGIPETIFRGEMVRLERVRTLTDFKLLQLSWVFDLNFPESFRILAERGYIGGLAATLPACEELAAAVAAVREHVRRRCEPAVPSPEKGADESQR